MLIYMFFLIRTHLVFIYFAKESHDFLSKNSQSIPCFSQNDSNKFNLLSKIIVQVTLKCLKVYTVFQTLCDIVESTIPVKIVSFLTINIKT
jgi:hypothetical protein